MKIPCKTTPLKYRKRIAYNKYTPKSLLNVPRTQLERADCPVIDAHTHFGGHTAQEPFEKRYETAEIVRALQRAGVAHCIELTLFTREMWDRVHEKIRGYEDFFSFCAPVDLSGFQQPGFEERLLEEMEAYAAEGAVGFKVWKDLGFSVRDRSGNRVKINDPALGFIWDKAAELDLPIVIHVADPPAYFEPADRYNERLEEIVRYHFWHHYRKGLRFMDFMEELDDLLEKWPDTRFQAAHLCSYPGNLDYVSGLMRKHPNLYTDIAATLADIGRQPRRFSRFAAEFRDRIFFGTDYFAGDPLPHLPYFRFLETEDEYFPYNVDGKYEHGRWNIYGCGLPDDIKKRLYYQNAESFFGLELRKDDGKCG